MYRLLLFVALSLSISSAFECLPHVCSAAFQACNHTGDHDCKQCWQWADDTFHCCGECQPCTNTNSKFTKATEWERECRPQLCDTVFDICSHVHPNDTLGCLQKADHASHCCYFCLDCPSAHAQFPPKRHHHCEHQLCLKVYEACTEAGHDPQRCEEIADDAAHCRGACGGLIPPYTKSKREECHPKLCTAIFDVCNYVQKNSSECLEKADVATNCCYNCVDCPSDMKPVQPKSDHCNQDLCDHVFQACLHTEHSHDECRVFADNAAKCCNMCEDCH